MICSFHSKLDLYTSTAGTDGDEMDIYRGSHPDQVMAIRPLLQELGDRTRNLLETWPDHPALTQVSCVINWIQLHVTSRKSIMTTLILPTQILSLDCLGAELPYNFVFNNPDAIENS